MIARPCLFALLLVGSSLLAATGCASSDAFRAGDIEVRVEGATTPAGTLLSTVSRELAAFGAGRHRAAHAADAAYGVELALRQRGFAHAAVTFEILPNEDAPETLVLRVDEGPVARYGEITFPGRAVFRSSELESLLRRGRSGLFVDNDLFRQADVDAAVSDIARIYRLSGHLRARVGPARITWNDDRTVASILVPVREGRRFEVGRIELDKTLPKELRQELRDVLPERGSPFHLRVATEAAARVRGRLREMGHREADVSAKHEIDNETATAHIRIDAVPGPVHVLGTLTLDPTERTDPDFARDRVALQPGDLLRQSALDDAIDGLYATGAFARVRLDPTTRDATDDQAVTDLRVLLDESQARSFEAGGGWGSYELLRGWVAYRDRNFTGHARSLDIEARASLKSAALGARAADRYILGPNHTLSSGLRYEYREEPSFDSRAVDFDVQIRHDVDRQHHVTYGYRMRIEEARDRDSVIRGAEDERSRAAGLFTTVGHDTRDDRLFPTNGVLADFGLFWSSDALGADLEFLEWHASWARYVPIGKKTVLAFGGRFITRDVLDEARTLPVQERLFLGGESSVRSFYEAELGPTDGDDDPRGGLTSAMASVELRRPIWRDLDGALFYDVGVVSSRALDIDAGAGAAIGVGLRYRLPVGPVRLDFGYNPLHRFASDRRWAVHLSFGFSF